MDRCKARQGHPCGTGGFGVASIYSGVISIERVPPRFMRECTLNVSGIFQFNSILNEKKNIVAHKGHYEKLILVDYHCSIKC